MKAVYRRGQAARSLLVAVVACTALAAVGQDEGIVVTDEGSMAPGIEASVATFRPAPAAAGVNTASLTNHASAVWTGQIDALWLWRGNVPSLPLFTDSVGDVALNADDARPIAATGPRVGIIRRIGDCHAIEGNYLNVGTFNGEASLFDTGEPYEIENLGNLPTFGDVSSATVSTWSVFKSAEFNGRALTGGPITWLAGFRWVEWDDRMNIDYTYANPDPYGAGNLDAHTGNNLYGGQIGADMRLWNTEGIVRVDGITKAGVFYNHAAYQRSSASFAYPDGSSDLAGSVNATDETVSFMGEVGLNASVSITRWLAWRAGYSVFWLSGVATAPQQFAASDLAASTGSVNTNGSVLLHGVTTGLEARW